MISANTCLFMKEEKMNYQEAMDLVKNLYKEVHAPVAIIDDCLKIKAWSDNIAERQNLSREWVRGVKIPFRTTQIIWGA